MSCLADVVAGVLWAAEHAAKAGFAATVKARHKGSVVSMSLDVGIS